MPGGNYDLKILVLCSSRSPFRSSCFWWMQELDASNAAGLGAELRRLDVAGCSSAGEYAGYRRISSQPGNCADSWCVISSRRYDGTARSACRGCCTAATAAPRKVDGANGRRRGGDRDRKTERQP
jgi:hypothetical protein